MAKTVTISLPHDLTQAEARARLEKGLAEFRTSHASRLGQVQERWTDNTLDFDLHAAGQQITGKLDVLPHEVKLAVNLPWMLALLAQRFTKQVETEGRKMLEKK